jgi:hypothetical protein
MIRRLDTVLDTFRDEKPEIISPVVEDLLKKTPEEIEQIKKHLKRDRLLLLRKRFTYK